jgi:hypothetical protein
MSRRLIGGALVATSQLVATPHSYAPIAAVARAGCQQRINDGSDDAKPALLASGTTTVPDPRDTSITGLDVVSVTMRATADTLETYVELKKLPAALDTTESAYEWDVTFSNDIKNFKLQHMLGNTAQPDALRPDLTTPKYPKGSYATGSGVGKALEVKADVDTAKNMVLFTVPLAALATALERPLAADEKFTKIAVETYLWRGNSTAGGTSKQLADTATATDAKAEYTIGEDPCFGPPPAMLDGFEAAPASVQFSDVTELSVALYDEGAAPLEGKTVQFAVAGEATPLTDTTDAEGVAAVNYTPKLPAGTYDVLVTFAGDEAVGKAKLKGTVTVKQEVTKFAALVVAKPTTTTRVVTATLNDDDRHPVAGQKVDFYVNGKKVATVVTNSKGQAVYKGAKPLQSVQAKFATVTGKYTGSNSEVKKV